METQPKPIFNKRIFWDVVFENIDYDEVEPNFRKAISANPIA